MKILVTVIRTNIDTNFLFFFFWPFVKFKNKNWICLLVRKKGIILIFVYTVSRSTSKAYRIQKNFIKEFFTYYSCLYYSLCYSAMDIYRKYIYIYIYIYIDKYNTYETHTHMYINICIYVCKYMYNICIYEFMYISYTYAKI